MTHKRLQDCEKSAKKNIVQWRELMKEKELKRQKISIGIAFKLWEVDWESKKPEVS